MNKPKILFVDDDVGTRIYCLYELNPYFDVRVVISAIEMFKLLEDFIPDLIVLDIDMPEMDGFEGMIRLKADQRYKHIPVIFLSGSIDKNSKLRAHELGAIDYLDKVQAFIGHHLARRIANHFQIQNFK